MTRTETQQTGRRPLLTALAALIAMAAIFLPAPPAAAEEVPAAPGAPVGLVLTLGDAKLVAG